MIRSGAAALVAGSLVLGAGAAGPARSLEVATGRGVVWRAAIADGERFDLAFRHSSERCIWTQHYRATAEGIWQEGSTFPCFGAGMPAASTDGSAVMRTEGGYFVRAPRLIGELPMLGWRRGEITIALGGRTVALGLLVGDFEPFTVSVR